MKFPFNLICAKYIYIFTHAKYIIQIMTDHEGTSQLFLDPPESLEPDGFFCWPRDQSLFVLLYHMPTLNNTS